MRLVWYRGTFAAYWRDAANRPRRASLATKDRSLAERRLRDFEATQRVPVTTVGKVFEAYVADKPAERHTYAWKRLGPVFAPLRPDQVDRAICRVYAARRRAAGARDGTIIKELATLRAALRWHDKNTLATIELPSAPEPKDLYLTREQYRALREAARQTPHLYVFVILAYTTAGRREALLDLTWDRVDFSRGFINLMRGARKRNKARATVPMTDSAREALLEVRRAALTDYVVEFAGQPVHSVRTAFDKAAERAGVPWCTPHVLRHTAAVHMVESGVPLSEISQYLGHTSTAVTEKVYARYSPEYLKRAASALE